MRSGLEPRTAAAGAGHLPGGPAPPIAPHQRPDGSTDAGSARQRLPVAARETVQAQLYRQLVEGWAEDIVFCRRCTLDGRLHGPQKVEGSPAIGSAGEAASLGSCGMRPARDQRCRERCEARLGQLKAQQAVLAGSSASGQTDARE